MARLKAQANDPAAQEAKLSRAVSAATDRISKLNNKLEQAEDDAKKIKYARKLNRPN